MMLVENVMDHQNPRDKEFLESGSVSCLHKCTSEDAKKLCIYDSHLKLKQNAVYDIGGTCTGNESDLWFSYSTSTCLGNNYLLNLFVCNRKTGNFSVGISNSNELTHIERANEISGYSVLPRTLTWFTFKSSRPDQLYHIKTFCFTDKMVKSLEPNILFIPISVVMNSSHTFSDDVLMSIKLQHDLSRLLTKQEKTDFVMISASGKRFPVHKIVIVAHSPILRNIVKDTETESFIDIKDSDMELLLQFLYTGTINDIFNHDCMDLLRIADKFQLENLFLLTQYALYEQISIMNAVEIAVISQKYKLDKLQKKVFRFIKNNPQVMQTKGWKELKDVELTKQLIEYIYTGWD